MEPGLLQQLRLANAFFLLFGLPPRDDRVAGWVRPGSPEVGEGVAGCLVSKKVFGIWACLHLIGHMQFEMA